MEKVRPLAPQRALVWDSRRDRLKALTEEDLIRAIDNVRRLGADKYWRVYADYNVNTMDYTITEVVQTSTYITSGRGRYPTEFLVVRAEDELGAYKTAMEVLKERYG